MNTNYEQLRTRINELLPDRLKLEFRCEIEGPWGNAIILSKAREFLKKEKKYLGQRYHILKGRTASTLSHIAIKKVIGKPLTIEDVLRALNIAGPQFCQIASNGTLHRETEEHDVEILARFDLTKSLSAPENDEACGAVLELLK